ncbi:uncharacterized protein AB9W97_011556 isoform 1-T3 [Spinachia spinachia]
MSPRQHWSGDLLFPGSQLEGVVTRRMREQGNHCDWRSITIEQRTGNQAEARLPFPLQPLCIKQVSYLCTSSHQSVKLLKFADETTLLGPISGGDESAYRWESDHLVTW